MTNVKISTAISIVVVGQLVERSLAILKTRSSNPFVELFRPPKFKTNVKERNKQRNDVGGMLVKILTN